MRDLNNAAPPGMPQLEGSENKEAAAVTAASDDTSANTNLSEAPHERKLHVSIMQDPADGGCAKVTNRLLATWPKLRDRLYKEPKEASSKGARGLYKFAAFRPADGAPKGYRDSEHFVAAGALALDYDKCADGVWAVLCNIYGVCEGVVHTSYSDGLPDKDTGVSHRKFRVVLTLSRSVDAIEYNALGRLMIAKADPTFSKIDIAASTSAVQGMFLPVRRPGGPWERHDLNGEPIDVDAELAVLGPSWRTDRSRWPGPDAERATAGAAARDPRQAPGVIGAFNRAYDIETAIDKFDLPYERAGDRFRYLHAAPNSTPAASLKFDGYGLLSMHLNHDPAAGHVCGAFDLVRIHWFGRLDSSNGERQ